MSFGGFERGQSQSQPMAEINVTPLVDVMLVLLVIFIITAPLLAYALKIDLPEVTASPSASRPDTVKLTIESDGTLRWDDERIDEAQLTLRLQEASKKQPQPELHLLADKGTRYEALARVMSAAQQAGITKLGFVTEPPQPEGPAATESTTKGPATREPTSKEPMSKEPAAAAK